MPSIIENFVHRTQSLNSLNSVGFAAVDDDRDGHERSHPYEENSNYFDENRLEAENHYIPSDIFSLIVTCEQHQVIVLQKILNGLYFFPSLQFENSCQSWSQLNTMLLELVLKISESLLICLFDFVLFLYTL